MHLRLCCPPAPVSFILPFPLKIPASSWINNSLTQEQSQLLVPCCFLFNLGCHSWFLMFISWNSVASSWHLQPILLLSIVNINLISVITTYSKPWHRKSHRVLSISQESPPLPFYVIPYKKINIWIMYSSNLVLTQSLTSLWAWPAMSRSYQPWMPQPCLASPLPPFW